GLWIAVLLVPFVMSLTWACGPLLDAFGIDPDVRHQTTPYMRALNWSSLPLLLYFALRRYVQATGAAREVMLALVTANVVNALGCWALVFGHLGAPRMGTEGAGWATCISRLYMAGFLATVAFRKAGVFPDWALD